MVTLTNKDADKITNFLRQLQKEEINAKESLRQEIEDSSKIESLKNDKEFTDYANSVVEYLNNNNKDRYSEYISLLICGSKI